MGCEQESPLLIRGCLNYRTLNKALGNREVHPFHVGRADRSLRHARACGYLLQQSGNLARCTSVRGSQGSIDDASAARPNVRVEYHLAAIIGLDTPQE